MMLTHEAVRLEILRLLAGDDDHGKWVMANTRLPFVVPLGS